MKKSLFSIVAVSSLCSALSQASAGTVNLYVEDWGSGKGAVPANFSSVGWTLVTPAANNPPYEGFYAAGSAYNLGTGNPLPVNTIYYTGLAAGQEEMFYTTDAGGAGSSGDAAFTDINPASYTALTLSVAGTDQGTTATNYFAVQVGGAWYVSTTALQGYNAAYPSFVTASLPYTTTASAWNQLTINANSVTIGAAATADLSGPITGIGIVETGPGGWNYNEITVSAYAPTASKNVYTEDWGSIKGTTSASVGNVGWTFVEPSSLNPPYVGLFQSGGVYDVGTGNPLPTNTIYYTGLAAGQTEMFYTTDSSGAGSEGDTSFSDFDAGNYTNLTLSVEASDNGSSAANYFAVQVGGAWYVSTTALAGSNPGYPGLADSTLPYSQLASAWNQLTINSTNVTIGGAATNNLSGAITGIGIVAVGPGGWNYNEIAVTAYAPPIAVTPPNATVYAEDWGTQNYLGTGFVDNSLTNVGWSSAGVLYPGIYQPFGSIDPITGATFPPPPHAIATNNACYASLGNSVYIGIVYTTDTNGGGLHGDSEFSDINPVDYSGDIVFNAESQYNFSTPATSYFAVQIGAVAGVGGQWYVSTTAFANNTAENPFFASNSLAFNPGSNNWDQLTFPQGPIDTTGSVVIGGLASNDLSGPITGVGIVLVGDSTYGGGATGYGLNYGYYSITTPLVNSTNVAPKIDAAGFSATAYAGGTASFAVDAYIGTAPLSYTWTLTTGSGSTVLADGNTGTGSSISGANTDLLTIVNVGSADAGTYSVAVSNAYGSDDSLNYATNTLTVNPVPNDVLYAETFPFVGPFTTGELPTAVGWFAAAPGNPQCLDYVHQLFAYEGSAGTTGFFTSSATDVPGLSGLPFTNINFTDFPFVSFRATMATPSFADEGNITEVTPFFAVQMTGGQWYVSSSSVQLAAATTAYTAYGLQFSPAMLEWDTLTLTGSAATIGSTATADLTGDITGVGLVFVSSATAATALELDIQSFEVVTESTPPALASFPSEPNVPYSQTVYAGGGASFFFTEAGTLPLTNNWQFNDNGIDLVDGVTATGSIISGANTTEITIENVSSADGGSYDPTVSNAAGTNNTDGSEYGPPILTVAAPPVGLIYNESFAIYQPYTANQPLSVIGWTNQSDSPTRLYKEGTQYSSALVGQGSAYAYEAGPANTLFYASTETDTGFAGLPFIAFDPANYPADSIQFTTAMVQGNANYTNVSASFAIEEDGQWYAMATPFFAASFTPAVVLSSTATSYTPFGPQTYSPVASQWLTLTFGPNNVASPTNVVVGGNPAKNLSGPITAAGILFQHGTSGGDLNWNFYQINATSGTGGPGTGIGGLNIGVGAPNGVTGVSNAVTLTWVGNPSVSLQSSTDLIHWTNVTNTSGNHTLTISATNTDEFYRVTGP